MRIIFPTFTREFVYDKRGRKLAETDYYTDADNLTHSLTTSFTYDAAGNMETKTDRNGYVTTYYYDNLNRLMKTIAPVVSGDTAAGETSFVYDTRDNLLALTDAAGNTTVFTYDRNNRSLSETRPGGGQTRYKYDAAGRLIEKIDPQNRKITYEYDLASRLTFVRSFTSATDTTAVKTVTYTYDAAGNLRTYADGATSAVYTYDKVRRKTAEAVDYGAFSLSQSYSFYKNGRKKTYTGPDNIVYSYSYDANNQLAMVNVPGQGNVTFNEYTWNRPKTVTLPGNSTKNYSYDPLMRLTGIQVLDPGLSTLLDYSYSHDDMGNIVGRIVTENATAVANVYGYDELYRLGNVTKDAVATESYSYDKVGNRLTAQGVVGEYVYNAGNELAARSGYSYDYDANGNTIARKDEVGAVTLMSYQYDIDNRLISVDSGNTASYGYDPFGRRLWKEVNGVRTYFFYSEEGLVGEFDAAGVEVKSYGWLPGSTWGTDPLFLKETVDSVAVYYWYLNDHLGTPQKMIDISGQVVWSAEYDAFGGAVVGVGLVENNLRFPGQYYDGETGLHYNWNRYYDPQTDRYITADPIGLSGGINLYGYVDGNPINYTDPLGLKKFCTDWRTVKEGLYKTGKKTGVTERILRSWQIVEMFAVVLPYRLVEYYHLEQFKKIRVKTRKCFEVDECGEMHESDEFDHDDLGKYWKEFNDGYEWVPWNDLRFLKPSYLGDPIPQPTA